MFVGRSLGMRRCVDRESVRWFKDDRGYGRITAAEGEVLFVSFSTIVAAGYGSLVGGERISFVWNGGIQNYGRHRADDVRLEAR
jgi:cold shock CspA family protein